MSRRRRNDSDENSEWFRWIWLIVVIVGSGAIAYYLLPFIILGGIGYGIYRYNKHKSRRLEAQKMSIGQIDDLKSEIGQADRRIKELETYLEQGDMEHYQELALQVLPQLTYIKNSANDLREDISTDIYQRILNKIRTVTTQINEQLQKIEQEQKQNQQAGGHNLRALAPELVTTVHNIQVDHEAILKKIAQSESNNKEELTAIHQSQMEHFEDILEGYLKIKASPKDFYNAEERLSKAKAALEQFDLDLDETLRQLNEADLRDFDISLRILDKKKQEGMTF